MRHGLEVSRPTLPGLPQAGPTPCQGAALPLLPGQACGRLAESTGQGGEGVPRRAEHSCPQRLEDGLKRMPILQQKQDLFPPVSWGPLAGVTDDSLGLPPARVLGLWAPELRALH